MRKVFVLAAAAALVVLSACSSTPSTADPYQVLDEASRASYDALVQVNLGLDVTGSDQPIHLDPSTMRLVLGTRSGKADVALALPLDALHVDAATRAALGVSGDTLDLDVRFDGAALYTKSPMLQPLLSALVRQTGGTPGDYSGWVRLGTKEELAGLAANLVPQASGAPVGSAGPLASHDAASLKRDLEGAGITLTFVERTQRSGHDADHLAAKIDASKLRTSPLGADLTGTQISQIEAALSQVDLKMDLWFAADSHRLVEIDATATGKVSAGASAGIASGEKVSMVLLVSTPSDGSALEAPTDFSELQLAPIIRSLLQSFGQGLFTTP